MKNSIIRDPNRSSQTPYADARPQAQLRLEAIDFGPVLRHGNEVDRYGARDVFVFEHQGTYFMHYDAAGEVGWLCALATSDDGVNWTKQGSVLELGKLGTPDSASASFGTVFFDSQTHPSWHMFYLGTPNVNELGKVPAFPYQTLKARAENPQGPWTKQPRVMSVSTISDTFYADTASPGQVLEHGGEYLMFFSAAEHRSDGIKRTLGLARTPNLNSAWTVDAEPLLPVSEQVENSSLYFEPSSSLWYLFTNHIGIHPETLEEYTDAVWVYWSQDLTHWNSKHKAVVLDHYNCTWSPHIIGLPSVVKIGSRLALYYDGCIGDNFGHMERDVGLAWLELPLVAMI